MTLIEPHVISTHVCKATSRLHSASQDNLELVGTSQLALQLHLNIVIGDTTYDFIGWTSETRELELLLFC